MNFRIAVASCFLTLLCSAAPPAHYYDAAAGKAGTNLLSALHAIIRNHHSLPYSSSSFDTSDALIVLDRSPSDPASVTLVYNGSNLLATALGAPAGWDREHLWPQSYGLDGVVPSYSDLFNLRACDSNVNSSRGNKYYDFSDPYAAGYKAVAYPEAPLCSTDFDSWQPMPSERGDLARAMFYMVARYNGDTVNEPALVLTGNPALIVSTNACMGRLSTLLAWHNADPVDAAEQLRNDRIYTLYQFNRNPFVDHPEWVNLTFAPACSNPPVINIARAANGFTLEWLATNQASHLEISTNLPGGWVTVTNPPVLNNTQFQMLWTNRVPRAFFRLSVP